MPKFLLSYRTPRDYTSPPPEAVAAWKDWLNGLGANLVDFGNPVAERSAVGRCGADTQLGGYSLITAENMEDAVAFAQGSPGLALGCGVEVGELMAPR